MLVLRDVLGFHAAEVAEMLETTEASVNSALQRARGALDARAGGRPRAGARCRTRRASASWSSASPRRSTSDDIDAVVALLTDDALLTMPPEPLEYEGPATVAAFLRDRHGARGGRRIRLVATRANGQPAFGHYIEDPHAAGPALRRDHRADAARATRISGDDPVRATPGSCGSSGCRGRSASRASEQ